MACSLELAIAVALEVGVATEIAPVGLWDLRLRHPRPRRSALGRRIGCGGSH